MSTAYSNRALPPGVVLREWRLEEVLGVGGFGIVYKARGIYFNELVAIKEYFPSSIAERQDDDTVVAIDSKAEEVHALGLKKFVEEAKLLWNLSTPSRHPNIVSVRSMFEIHGTAYIVMDFEDGASLSSLLKEGRRFNQASLTDLIVPVAEGLERAHRVGVLHRDIKPPNILVNNDGKSVLIDFGSARFESGEATSTSVSFYTPPYAAIEQYVKTYEQGPWTDIYALGVVMYECVTGEKPPEVLERLHAGKDVRLVGGDWPGFGTAFLAAIDAAMTIRPDDRPQNIFAWLKLFDRTDDDLPNPPAGGDDEDATKIVFPGLSDDRIVPVAPTPPSFKKNVKVKTQVPETPSNAEFKRRGEEDSSARNLSAKAAATPEPAAAEPVNEVSEGAAVDGVAPTPGPVPDNYVPPFRRRRRLPGPVRLAISLGKLAGWFVVLSSGITIAYRFVDPPTTTGMFFHEGEYQNTWVPLSEMSPSLLTAVIVSQQPDFCGPVAEPSTDVAGQPTDESADKLPTISHQAARQVFLWKAEENRSNHSIRSRLEDWFSLLINVVWGKRRTMEIYLNAARTGSDSFGVEAAAQRLFKKSAANLSDAEAARIAGTLTDPANSSARRPVAQPRNAKANDLAACVSGAQPVSPS